MGNLEAMHQEIEKLKCALEAKDIELARARARDKAYLWKHIGHFEWDFTTGMVEQEVTLKTPNGTMGLVQAAGLALPCRIDDLACTLADKYVDPAYAYWFRTNLSTEFVSSTFEKYGSFELAFERKLKGGIEGFPYARYSAPVIKDPETGHLMARFVVTDVTNRYNLVAPIEYAEIDVARAALIRALKNVFLLVYYVDIEHDTFEEFAATTKVHGIVSMQHGSLSARKTIQFLASVIKGDARARFEKFSNVDTLTLRMGQSPMLTEEFCTSEGLWVAISFTVVSRNEAGEISAIIITAQDVTRNREHEMAIQEARDEAETRFEEIAALNDELEEARQAADAANDAKTSFLFNMSHDIRTPMNAIIGFTGLIEKHQEDPQRRVDYLHKIKDSSTVLLSIINNVLDMARIEKGAVSIEEDVWGAAQFNDTIHSAFDDMMKAKGITFTRSINVEHEYVYCDTTKTTQVFYNILSNAMKYTEPGGTVNMLLEEVHSDRPGYAAYRTTITDTGIGMDADYLPHLFEEFSREHTSTETKVEGTGLGMPIVKRLIDLMKGTIEVASEKGVGTTFVVTLPHRIAEKTVVPGRADKDIDPELFKGKRILLAEDNDLNAEIACEILGEAGFVVERANDGAIAIAMLQNADPNYYDVVLMDIQMPNMNGYQATRAIRAFEDTAKAQTPILAMTANAFEEDKREALRTGMNGHIAKPINVNELMQALADVLA